MDNKLQCELCGKDLCKSIGDGLILLVKNKNQKIVDVRIACRGNCDNSMDHDIRKQGFSCGFKEMNNGLKNIYYKEDFTKDSLEKYEYIINQLDS